MKTAEDAEDAEFRRIKAQPFSGGTPILQIPRVFHSPCFESVKIRANPWPILK